jgi:hypothetical protein
MTKEKRKLIIKDIALIILSGLTFILPSLLGLPAWLYIIPSVMTALAVGKTIWDAVNAPQNESDKEDEKEGVKKQAEGPQRQVSASSGLLASRAPVPSASQAATVVSSGLATPTPVIPTPAAPISRPLSQTPASINVSPLISSSINTASSRAEIPVTVSQQTVISANLAPAPQPSNIDQARLATEIYNVINKIASEKRIDIKSTIGAFEKLLNGKEKEIVGGIIKVIDPLKKDIINSDQYKTLLASEEGKKAVIEHLDKILQSHKVEDEKSFSKASPTSQPAAAMSQSLASPAPVIPITIESPSNQQAAQQQPSGISVDKEEKAKPKPPTNTVVTSLTSQANSSYTNENKVHDNLTLQDLDNAIVEYLGSDHSDTRKYAVVTKLQNGIVDNKLGELITLVFKIAKQFSLNGNQVLESYKESYLSNYLAQLAQDQIIAQDIAEQSVQQDAMQYPITGLLQPLMLAGGQAQGQINPAENAAIQQAMVNDEKVRQKKENGDFLETIQNPDIKVLAELIFSGRVKTDVQKIIIDSWITNSQAKQQYFADLLKVAIKLRLDRVKNYLLLLDEKTTDAVRGQISRAGYMTDSAWRDHEGNNILQVLVNALYNMQEPPGNAIELFNNLLSVCDVKSENQKKQTVLDTIVISDNLACFKALLFHEKSIEINFNHKDQHDFKFFALWVDGSDISNYLKSKETWQELLKNGKKDLVDEISQSLPNKHDIKTAIEEAFNNELNHQPYSSVIISSASTVNNNSVGKSA